MTTIAKPDTIEILKVKRSRRLDAAAHYRQKLSQMSDTRVTAVYISGGYEMPDPSEDIRENLVNVAFLKGVAIIDRQIARLQLGLSAHPAGRDPNDVASEVDAAMARLGLR
jgi:hypothetical protein